MTKVQEFSAVSNLLTFWTLQPLWNQLALSPSQLPQSLAEMQVCVRDHPHIILSHLIAQWTSHPFDCLLYVSRHVLLCILSHVRTFPLDVMKLSHYSSTMMTCWNLFYLYILTVSGPLIQLQTLLNMLSFWLLMWENRYFLLYTHQIRSVSR